MKKRIILFLAMVVCILPVLKAEEETSLNTVTQEAAEETAPLYRSIYAELFGASNLIGISYDCRIKPGSPFGYRAGISYIHGTADANLNFNGNQVYSSNEELNGFAVPLEFNCILGPRKSKFEVAFGLNIGVYTTQKYSYYDDTIFPSLDYKITERHTAFGYYFFSNIGYRYQRKNGFMLRVGVSPSFSFGGSHGIRKFPLLYPYLSLGYTIGNKL